MKTVLFSTLLLASSLSFSNCRFVMKCIDSKVVCSPAKLSIKGDDIVGKAMATAKAKDIFLCQDNFGNIFEQLFPSSLQEKVVVYAPHGESNPPRSINDIDQGVLDAVTLETQVVCSETAAELELNTQPCP